LTGEEKGTKKKITTVERGKKKKPMLGARGSTNLGKYRECGKKKNGGRKKKHIQ